MKGTVRHKMRGKKEENKADTSIIHFDKGLFGSQDSEKEGIGRM